MALRRLSTMSTQSKWIYKIQPHSSVDTRFTFPIPIPASHTFFLSELDYRDGFVHLSTGGQVPKTLERFFADVPAVTLLRLETERVGAFKRIRWEGDGDESGSARIAPFTLLCELLQARGRSEA
jgi:hypothetical protein